MKKGLILLLVSLWFLSCGKSNDPNNNEPEPEQRVSVKTMTYNIWGARTGGIPEGGLEAIAEVIKRQNPDLVALQEVDKNTTRNPIDIAKELAELTDMEYFFARAEVRYGGEYGDAVLSKLPIKERKGYNLETAPGHPGEIRAVARVTVEKEGKEFHFISTHFDHLSDEANRLKQARDFVDILKEYDKPVIVGADFNALPGSETMDILRGHLSLGCFNNNCAFTFPTPNSDPINNPNRTPSRTIDYLMYAPSSAMTVQSYAVDTWASSESDHFPVVATFQLR